MIKRRNTTAKDSVLRLLSNSTKALSHEAIARQIEPVINRTTIYRILNRFCEDGIAHKVVGGDGKQYFSVRGNCGGHVLPEHHFHFRCTNCQTLECMDEEVEFSLPEGYRLEASNCLLTGTCRKCSLASHRSEY